MAQIDQKTLAAVRQFVDRLSGRFDLAGAIIYGSRARGDFSPDSDTDVAIILHGEHKRLLPLVFEMSDIAYDVLLETEVNIHPLIIWVDQWENPESYSNPTLLYNISKDGVRL